MFSENGSCHSKQTKTHRKAVFLRLSLQAVSYGGVGNGNNTVVIAEHGQSVSQRKGDMKIAEKLFDLTVNASLQYLVSAPARPCHKTTTYFIRI